MNSDELRAAFTEFWVAKGHLKRPSASLIPHEKSLLFTVAGMVPFMPYFLGEEVPPAKRITTIHSRLLVAAAEWISTIDRRLLVTATKWVAAVRLLRCRSSFIWVVISTSKRP